MNDDDNDDCATLRLTKASALSSECTLTLFAHDDDDGYTVHHYTKQGLPTLLQGWADTACTKPILTLMMIDSTFEYKLGIHPKLVPSPNIKKSLLSSNKM